MSVATITRASQYLTFKLDEEMFAVEVVKVREILEFTRVTRVPQMPHYMRGVINLRGSVVPVVDLRLKFGMSETLQTVHTCILVVEVELDREVTLIGALADSVQEVSEMEPDQIEAVPKLGTKVSADFIKGMGKRNDSFLMILDMDKVFAGEELRALGDTSAAGEPEEGPVLELGDAAAEEPAMSA